MKKFDVEFYKEGGSWYLIPTVLIMPKLSIWDDESQTWFKIYKTFNITLCFLNFSLAFNINYKEK